MHKSVLVVDEHDETITIMTLNRPERRNALSIELMEAIVQEFESRQASACRVVIIRGAGPAFCAGLDLIEAANSDVAQESAEWVARTFQTVVESPLVTIAAVHGAAMGGGAGLMAACDFAVGAEDLRIGFPETRRGLVPALVTTLLCHRLRDAELRELLLLAETIDAPRALRIGLLHRVVSTVDLLTEALNVARTIQLGAPQAIRTTKQLVRRMCLPRADEMFRQALEDHSRARQSAEAMEGLAAFRERRDPDWSQFH